MNETNGEAETETAKAKPPEPPSQPDKKPTDPKVKFLVGAGVILAAVVAAVLIFGGSSEPDNTDLSKKPVIVAANDSAPTDLVVEDIVEGKGAGAQNGDKLSVQYVGALYDTGAEFDTSWDDGKPFDVTLGQGQVIKGWDQGLLGMKAGGRREIVIPPDLGYGETGSPPSIPGNATLRFIVDLEKIN